MVSFYIPPTSDDAKRVVVAARDAGLQVHTSDIPQGDDPIVFFGSIEGMKANQAATGPYVDWCDWLALRTVVYYAAWGDMMLARKLAWYPLGVLRELDRAVWDWLGSSDGLFLRPDANDKPFDGLVVALRNRVGWYSMVRDLPSDLLCLVARPEPIEAEYRLWLADGEVVAASQYVREDRIVYAPGAPDTVTQFALRVDSVWAPHRVYCLDVAVRPDGWPPAVIECGSVHTCGLYAADPGPIVRAMARVAEEEYGS